MAPRSHRLLVLAASLVCARSSAVFSCDGGATVLEESRVNDDYCDCTDGMDETLTPACSHTGHSRFRCSNTGPLNQTISTSRVWDGVCDCCDGSDEPKDRQGGGSWAGWATPCDPNGCAALIEGEQARTVEDYRRVKVGLEKRPAAEAGGRRALQRWEATLAAGEVSEGLRKEEREAVTKLEVLLKVYLQDEERREKRERAQLAAAGRCEAGVDGKGRAAALGPCEDSAEEREAAEKVRAVRAAKRARRDAERAEAIDKASKANTKNKNNKNTTKNKNTRVHESKSKDEEDDDKGKGKKMRDRGAVRDRGAGARKVAGSGGGGGGGGGPDTPTAEDIMDLHWPLEAAAGTAEASGAAAAEAGSSSDKDARLKGEEGEEGPAATRAVRVLRLCRELCRVLPSKERAPYLVVAEVLQTPFSYASDRLYLEGGNSGVTCEDVVNKRTLPQALQEELLRSRGQDEWEEQEESALQSRHVELEVADRSFFDRATSQYLTSGDPSSHHVKNMREALQVFGTTSVALERMVRHQSPFGHLKGWQLAHFIVKAGDDFRMEALAMQVIRLVDNIFKREGLSLRLRPYAIVCCGDLKGLVECVTDAKSIDHIKKATAKSGGIRSFFERMYMGKTSGLYGRAVDNFVRSLAAYAIVTYMLQVKDRHNGNIMLDTRGHIVHIDFGYILGSAPGWWNHESAPFKFTQDYMEIMGGLGSDKWKRFRELFLTGFRAVQRHMREIEALIWPMFPSSDHRMSTQQILFRKRFMDFQTDEEILRLIDDSVRSWTTGQYDDFQQKTNGYLK